jgi:hypothetical protein
MLFFFVRILLVFVGMLVVYLVLKRWKKIEFGNFGSLGMLLVLLPPAVHLFRSFWVVYGLVAPLLGIFFIALGAAKGVRGERAKDAQ